MADPADFANVGLLLNCNGTDASTSFPDISNNAHTVTAVGDAQVDTAQSKFGGASAKFDGTGDRLTVPNATSINVATGDFTIEFWVRFEDAANSWSTSYLATQTHSSFYHPWWFVANAPGSPYYTISFNAYTTSDTLGVSLNHAAQLYKDIWYHVAVTRSGNTWRLFVDGASPVSTTSGSITLKTSTDPLTIGAFGSYGSAHKGWVDDFRLVKGEALYTSAFTPPTAELSGPPTPEVYVELPGPLGAPAVLAVARTVDVRAAFPSPLSACAALMYADYSGFLTGNELVRYFMDLITPAGLVRVPISSWQATLRVTRDSYVGCVVPSCAPWIDSIDVATEFRIVRYTTTAAGIVIQQEMARAPLETVQIDQGPTNYTASLSGYGGSFIADSDPSTTFDRVLRDIRSTSIYGSGVRVRCAIDWMLRPGQRAYYTASASLLPTYINYYANSTDSYMDVGESVNV